MEDPRQERGRCSMPPALDDVVLIAAVDGEAGADITAHLRACQHCAERARDFAELQGLLRKQLYRMFCPASDDLAALQQGLLNENQRAALAEHLAGCPHCTSELRMLAQATSEPLVVQPPPASSWLAVWQGAASCRRAVIPPAHAARRRLWRATRLLTRQPVRLPRRKSPDHPRSAKCCQSPRSPRPARCADI
jgi:anti-sigma factor RsiW